MPLRRYPHLTQLLGAYFHQDCYSDGEDDAGILGEFIANKTAPYVAATAGEIRSFLAAHPDDLLAALDAEFQPDIILGETDAEARAWLAAAAARLQAG